jgi:hypothetical protein
MAPEQDIPIMRLPYVYKERRQKKEEIRKKVPVKTRSRRLAPGERSS